MFNNVLKEAKIYPIDGNGESIGTISISYAPCDADGEEGDEFMPEEFIVEKAEELIGKKDLYFNLYIEHARNLPETLCCNAFVTY